MDKEFELFLELSDNLRKGYKNSLLPIQHNWRSVLEKIIGGEIPQILEVIYSKCSGTYYETQNQSLMDFVPGYLLIHISEYSKHYDELKYMLKQKNLKDEFLPVLRNYSSDFFVLNVKTNEMFLIFHDEDGIHLIHKNPETFLLTLINNYKENVYFLDEDGFLDYDIDLEYEVARKYNKDIEYWNDD